jgi:hypothetical protein
MLAGHATVIEEGLGEAGGLELLAQELAVELRLSQLLLQFSGLTTSLLDLILECANVFYLVEEEEIYALDNKHHHHHKHCQKYVKKGCVRAACMHIKNQTASVVIRWVQCGQWGQRRESTI